MKMTSFAHFIAHFNVEAVEDIYPWLAHRYFQTGYVYANQVERGYDKKRFRMKYILKVELNIRVKSKKEGLMLSEYLGCGHTYIRKSKRWNTYRWSVNGAKNIHRIIRGMLEHYPKIVTERDEIRVRRLGLVYDLVWDTVINKKGKNIYAEREKYIKLLNNVKAPKKWVDYSLYFRKKRKAR